MLFRSMFFNQGDFKSRVIKRGLTIDEVKAHCNSPESSSRTATTARAKARTKARGPWFDGFEEDR